MHSHTQRERVKECGAQQGDRSLPCLMMRRALKARNAQLLCPDLTFSIHQLNQDLHENSLWK